jgi:RHS repeat-associated protein
VVATSEIINQFDFKYDAAGNIIEEKTLFEPEPDINLEMTYQAANRLATIDDQIVQFDSDGNLTKFLLNGKLTNFTFDSRNRLTQAGSTVYRYDAENQRIGVNQTSYVVNSQPALSQVLVRTEPDGTQTFYVYGLGLIGQEIGGEYTNYHFDLRGSTVALTDKTAQVIERFQYSPYGLLLSGDASKTQFLFNGMYGVMTDDNGLYYMRARFYSPNIRRFINQDILLGNIVDGQSLNRFAYVTSNPISFVDPFGLFQLTPEYAKYLKTSGLVVTQLDSPMIGPGDIAGITLLLIGTGIDVYIILNSLHDDKHMDVNQALACIEDGSHGGDCNAIIEMINLLIESIKFRKIDLKRHLARNGTSYAQHPVYRSHKKRLNLEKQALRKLVELARLYNCAYDPEAEQLMN